MSVFVEESAAVTDAFAPDAGHTPVTVVFCGGGTGGHLTPGISVARALQAAEPAVRAVFLLTGRAAEAPFFAGGGQPDPEFEGHAVPAVRAPQSIREAAGFPFRWVKVRRAGARWIAYLDPDAAVGLGGYGECGPIRAAQRRGVPTILLEQNAVPGKANRWLARRATEVCSQWDAARGSFPRRARVHVTGNPIREQILNGSAAAAGKRFGLEPDRRTLLVLGGSQGSQRLNQAFAVAVSRCPELGRTWQIIHQHGPHDRETLNAVYAERGCPHHVAPFLEERAMADALTAADLVVSRAGATTLAEVTAVGRPAVLFPLPARDHHQQRNAEVLDEAGAARIVTDSGDAERSGADLSKILYDLCAHPDTLSAMAHGSRRLGVRDAAERVARLILEHAAERRRRR